MLINSIFYITILLFLYNFGHVGVAADVAQNLKVVSNVQYMSLQWRVSHDYYPFENSDNVISNNLFIKQLIYDCY